jgi:hypothetical protein
MEARLLRQVEQLMARLAAMSETLEEVADSGGGGGCLGGGGGRKRRADVNTASRK